MPLKETNEQPNTSLLEKLHTELFNMTSTAFNVTWDMGDVATKQQAKKNNAQKNVHVLHMVRSTFVLSSMEQSQI